MDEEGKPDDARTCEKYGILMKSIALGREQFGLLRMSRE